jgi:hypothetical protein
MTIYRGFEITQKPNGKFEWVDERNFVHTGMIDLTGGYDTEEAAMTDIDAYKRRMREIKN